MEKKLVLCQEGNEFLHGILPSNIINPLNLELDI